MRHDWKAEYESLKKDYLWALDDRKLLQQRVEDLRKQVDEARANSLKADERYWRSQEGIELWKAEASDWKEKFNNKERAVKALSETLATLRPDTPMPIPHSWWQRFMVWRLKRSER